MYGTKRNGGDLKFFFASVLTKEIGTESMETRQTSSEVIEPIQIKEEKVFAILKQIRVDKSPGPDRVFPRTLKETSVEIAGSLADIFKMSVSTGEVPEDWRIIRVVPLFKKGSKSNPGNYRPVSLTLLVGKFLEGVLRDRIYKYLDRHGLIRESQHGFVRGRSCLTNLLEFFEEVTRKVDEGKAVDVVYMDFSKAFYQVPHGKLIRKIQLLGIHGKVVNWIRHWLNGRSQRVVVEDCYSEWRPVTGGVPQGSVLGPLLFVISINDLGDNVVNWISKFADDTKIGDVVDSEEGFQSLQRDLDQLEE
ncbi:protein shisa-4 isoform X1 [Hypanus sabinus]|uniref:protein shisa-4 isoform X1 n=1 Tax=Hypanus sabinus TaxID=79690 RepID=UPI0028C4FB4A|nr:protein shisa-4 isoform X1 [Hypanus sabinus]